MTEDLFVFPIVMVDGENEERKEHEKDKYGDIPGQESPQVEYDIVYGEAEYPYYEFVGLEDRWLPTRRSLQKALKGKFDACIVRFTDVGQFLVPWNKEKFKEELSKFTKLRESLEEEEEEDNKMTVINFPADMLAKLINKDEK